MLNVELRMYELPVDIGRYRGNPESVKDDQTNLCIHAQRSLSPGHSDLSSSCRLLSQQACTCARMRHRLSYRPACTDRSPGYFAPCASTATSAGLQVAGHMCNRDSTSSTILLDPHALA